MKPNSRIVIFLSIFLVSMFGCQKSNLRLISNGTEAREILELTDVPEAAEGGIIHGRGYCGWVKMTLSRQQFDAFLANNGIPAENALDKREKVISRLSEINAIQNKIFFPPEVELDSWIDDRNYTIGIEKLSGDQLKVYLIVYRD